MEMSILRYEVQQNSILRQRIEGIVRNDWWNDDAPVRPDRVVPVSDLAWAVASNSTIMGSIETYMTNTGEGARVDDAIMEVTDNDLSYVVLTVALPRLGL